jgi:hypothetical protein
MWMLSTDCANIRISDHAHLSRESLLGLASLLIPILDRAGKPSDNLLQAVDNKCKGGHRAATTTFEAGQRKRITHPSESNSSSRTGRSHGTYSGGGFSKRKRETK